MFPRRIRFSSALQRFALRLRNGSCLFPRGSHCGSFRSRVFLHIHLRGPVGHQLTEAAPEGGQEATWGTHAGRKDDESHVKRRCNIKSEACFDLMPLITRWSATFKRFTGRLKEIKVVYSAVLVRRQTI